MTKLVTVFGGSGFVGRYVVQEMTKAGWRVRVATRRPNEALFVKPYGTAGQVEPVLCNVRDDGSVALALQGADAVVNCVGIMNEIGPNRFTAIHVEGAERVARLAAQQGVAGMVHISALGADVDSECEFSRTKAEGEAAVLTHMPDAVILRPSVIFGTEDKFFNRPAFLTRFSPFLPVAAAKTLLQPVFVEDVARATAMGVQNQADPGVYELGGPEVASMRELMGRMLKQIHRNRVLIGMPNWFARIMAFGFDMMQYISFGLVPNVILTRDQLRNLAHDNVVSQWSRGFADLDIAPVEMDLVLPDYLWRFRPSGQFDSIKDSARKLQS